MPITPSDAETSAPDQPAENTPDAVIAYVHDNPIRALLAAAAVGFVIGRLIF
jgi:ElaB/YqjD/DUF883 family membrane-anchored ribosome-binding protein